MALRRGTVVILVYVACTFVSCASQPQPASSLPPHNDVLQLPVLSQKEPERHKLSATDAEADCVLTTGNIHLWCKWITRYY
jgi:hypothetical protein